jgi:hypothetical protein
MNNSPEFGLIEPFETDNGSLKTVTPEYAFALGVEWAIFRQRLLVSDKPFRVLCLPENRERFVRMAERHKRFTEERRTACAGWFEIWVGDLISFA